MNTNKNIQNKIEDTFLVVDNIQKTTISPFFKDKTMKRLFAEKETIVSCSIWSWFTPKLQLATLACVVLINIYAINQVKDLNYEEEMSNFASDYGLSSESNSSIINLKS